MIVFVVVGFGFKVSAVPFHTLGAGHLRGRADPGHRVPVGRVEGRWLRGARRMVYLVLPVRATDVWQPFMFVLAALTMTVGNVLALRQTNIVRMLAYSIDQPGRVHPDAARRCRHGDAAGPR